MFVDSSGQRVFGTLGWVDHGAVWIFDGSSQTASQVPVSDAKYLTLQEGNQGYFSVLHHWEGLRLLLTAHHTDDPARPLASVDVRGWAPSTAGDTDIWHHIPGFYVGYLNDDAAGAAGYFLIALHGDAPQVARLDWFDDSGYDHMYQGLISVSAIPARDELLFGVQRSSELVLWDPATERVTRRIPLADRHGNPHPHVVSATEMWATDYDTVVKIDPSRWSIEGARLLQPPDPSGHRMFVGEPFVDRTRDEVLVPRPGTGDVVIVDRRDLSTLREVGLGSQPLTVATTSNGQVVARDWKTGDLLVASD